MTDEEQQEEEYETISIEYTPLELTTMIQLLDYLDIFMHQNDLPMGAVFLHRKKLYEAIIKEDVLDELEKEKKEKREEFEESFGLAGDSDVNIPNRDGFQ